MPNLTTYGHCTVGSHPNDQSSRLVVPNTRRVKAWMTAGQHTVNSKHAGAVCFGIRDAAESDVSSHNHWNICRQGYSNRIGVAGRAGALTDFSHGELRFDNFQRGLPASQCEVLV